MIASFSMGFILSDQIKNRLGLSSNRDVDLPDLSDEDEDAQDSTVDNNGRDIENTAPKEDDSSKMPINNDVSAPSKAPAQ